MAKNKGCNYIPYGEKRTKRDKKYCKNECKYFDVCGAAAGD